MFKEFKLSREKFAFISFVFGIITVSGIWTLETILAPLALLSIPLGLIFGILGLKSQRRKLAMAGIILSLFTWPVAIIFL